MCAMPANSFPRRAPAWPGVATHTQYEPGFDSILSRVLFATIAHPWVLYMWPRLATFIPLLSRIVADLTCITLSWNFQQSCPFEAWDCRLTIPWWPMPERWAPSVGCIIPARAIDAAASAVAATIVRVRNFERIRPP